MVQSIYFDTTYSISILFSFIDKGFFVQLKNQCLSSTSFVVESEFFFWSTHLC